MDRFTFGEDPVKKPNLVFAAMRHRETLKHQEEESQRPLQLVFIDRDQPPDDAGSETTVNPPKRPSAPPA